MSLIINDNEKSTFNEIINSLNIENNKHDYLKRISSSKSINFNINKNIYYKKFGIKRRQTLKNMKYSVLTNKNNKLENNNAEKKLILFSNKNLRYKSYKNILEKIKDDNNKKNKFYLKLQNKTKDSETTKKIEKNLEQKMEYIKKEKKLDDLKTLLMLIDTHRKTQYEIYLDPAKPKLNFIRNKMFNVNLYKPCITYNKNNLIFNKKYNLIFDSIKNKNKLSNNINYTNNSEENKLSSYSSNYSKQKNKNKFLKKKKLIKINSDNLFLQSNKDKYKEKFLYLYSQKDDKNKCDSYPHNDKKINIKNIKTNNINNNKIDINNNIINNKNIFITNYIHTNNKQNNILLDELTNNINNQKSSQNETTNICETSTISLVSDINNLKTYNNKGIKKSKINFLKNYNSKIKLKKTNKKNLMEILSETLRKSNKMNNILKLNYSDKEKEEEKEKKQEIKNLIKKKKTDLDSLVKDLNLYYKEQKIDLEELVINNLIKLKRHLLNMRQKNISNEIARKVIIEDKILSKQIILESALEKKLRSKKKNKSVTNYGLLLTKRKNLKNIMMNNLVKNEDEIINGLMKNENVDFNNTKSLEKLIYKYRAMSHYKKYHNIVY